MGRNVIEPSILLTEFFNKIDYEKDLKKLVKYTGYPKADLVKVFAGSRIPPFAVLTRILEFYKIDIKIIYEFAKKESTLCYFYWENLFPEEAPLNELKYVVRELMFEQNKSQRDLAIEHKTALTYISGILTGRTIVTHNSLKKFSKSFGLEPMELLNKLKNRKNIITKKKEFSQRIEKARVENGYTPEQASSLCQLSIYKYMDLEEAEIVVGVPTILRLCRGLRLDFKEIGELALEAKIILEKEEFDNILAKKKKIMLGRSEYEKKLEDEIFLMCCYENISHNQSTKYSSITMQTVTYNTLTVFTLFILALCNDFDGSEKYKNYIVYYLNQMNKGNDKELYKAFDFLNLLKNDDISMADIFEKHKEMYGLSYSQIGKMSNFTKGYISNKHKNDDFGDTSFLEKIFGAVNIPYCVGLHLHLKKKRKEIIEESISLHKIFSIFENTTVWIFRGKKVEKSTINGILTIIFSQGEAIEKYNKLKELKYPEI